MRASLISGTLWLTGAKVFTTAVGFVSTIILARLLVPEDFGLIAIAAATLAIVTALTDLPATVALIQIKQPSRTDYDTAWTLGTLRGALVMIALALAAPFVANAYGDDRLTSVIVALSVTPVLMGALNPYFVNYERDLRYSMNFVLEAVSKVVSVIISAAIALVWQSYWALVAGPVAAALITLILSYAMAPYLPRPSLGSIRIFWGFASWLTLVSIVNTLNQRVDQFVIGHVLGKSSLGHFTVGSDIAGLVHAPVTPIMRALYAGFSRMRDERPALLDAYRKSQRLLCSLAPPFGVGLALVAEPMVRIALGEIWIPAALVIEVLAPVFAFELLAGATYPLLMAQANTRTLFWRDLLVLAFRIPLMIVGIVFYGLIGLLVARAAASAFGLVLNIQLARRAIGFPYSDLIAGLWRPLCGVVAMAIALTALRTVIDIEAEPLLFLTIAVPLGAVIHIATVIGLWLLGGRGDGMESDALAFLAALRTKPADDKA